VATGERTRQRAWIDVFASVGSAARLIGRHWPKLLTAALLGVAFRNGVIWAAVWLSNILPWFAQVLLVFAPLGYLLPMVYMLRLCARDLPRLRAAISADAPSNPSSGRDQRLVDVAVSVLVPFLAVYQSYRLLEEDRNRFLNTAAADEVFNDFGSADGIDLGSRLQLGNPLWAVLAIVLVAVIVRWLLGRAERVWRFVGIAFLGAFIELFWTIYVSNQIEAGMQEVANWFLSRKFVAAVIDSWHGLVDSFGWVGARLDESMGLVLGLFGSFGPVIVVPIAWLVVASVIVGHKLVPPAGGDHPALGRVARIVPEGVRSAGESFLADVGSRWGAFFGGIGLVLRAGFIPVLSFCFLFLVPNLAPAAVSWVCRWVVGPTDTWTFLAFSPWEEAIGLALQLMLTAPIVVAALDAFVAMGGSDEPVRAPDGDAAPASAAAAAPEAVGADELSPAAAGAPRHGEDAP